MGAPLKPSIRGRGYALLLATLLLAAASAAMLSMGRIAWRAHADAAATRQEVQARWAAISLERAIRHRFASMPSKQVEVMRNPTGSIALTDASLRVSIADEGAKLNVARLWSELGSDPQRYDSVIAEWAELNDRRPPRIRPTAGRAGSVSLENWLHDSATLEDAEEYLTCDGDGRVNVRSAKFELVELWLRATTNRSLAAAFVEQLNSGKPRPLEAMVEAATQDEQDRHRLRSLLCDDLETLSVATRVRETMLVFDRRALIHRRNGGGWRTEVVRWR